MQRWCVAGVLVVALACGQEAQRPVDRLPAGDAGATDDAGPDAGTADAGLADAGPDAGTADAGLADAGTADAGPGDAGSADAGIADAGDADAGSADAGDADAGTADAGSDAGVAAHTIGGLGAGPWPTAPLTVYGKAQGLTEAPVSASTDEAQNLWVVSHSALYLLRPGEKQFQRFTAHDGLHVGAGFTDPPDITLVEGGAAGECFVGYAARDTHNPPNAGAHTAKDPYAHYGKMDQVLLQPNGTLVVRRYDLHNSNDPFFYETRTVTSMLYDHFQHPGDLYVGSNHGVTRIIPSRWRLPQTSAEKSYPVSVEREWYADHVHPWVCVGGPCSDKTKPSTFGDWYGLALGPDGRLWMAGLTCAGAIGWTADLQFWRNSWAPYNPFVPGFGDPYPGNPPVFHPPKEGDPVNLRAVTVTPDGTAWFASGDAEGWREPTYGVAAWDGHHFTDVDPSSIGAAEHNVLELQALPDGRLVLGFPGSGLLLWTPGGGKGRRITVSDGLPGMSIGRVHLDQMVEPWALYVPTNGGLAVFRAF